MQGIKNKLFLCIFLFVILIPIPNKVSAQSEFQTFEENPIEYWELNNIIATYNQNNTITIKQDDPYDTSVWFDTSFLYRKIVNISGSSGAGNNYQINFTVLYDSNMQTDFDDIRFTDNDKVTKLNYFRESYTASVSAKFWVRVTDSLDSDNYIYMYFGNSLASSESSGLNTFDFYDDFNDGSLNASKWGENIGSTGTPSESGGKLNYVGVASQWGSYCSFEEFTYNHAVRMKV